MRGIWRFLILWTSNVLSFSDQVTKEATRLLKLFYNFSFMSADLHIPQFMARPSQRRLIVDHNLQLNSIDKSTDIHTAFSA